MAMFIEFVRMFGVGLGLAGPVLVILAVIIGVMGAAVGRVEGWGWRDGVYWAFVTATTVGYGELVPRRRVSRHVAITIAILGMIFTGVIVAIALQAMTMALTAFHELPNSGAGSGG